MQFYEECKRMDNLVLGVDDFIKPIGIGLGELFIEVCYKCRCMLLVKQNLEVYNYVLKLYLVIAGVRSARGSRSGSHVAGDCASV